MQHVLGDPDLLLAAGAGREEQIRVAENVLHSQGIGASGAGPAAGTFGSKPTCSASA
ncbi:hypothetical protein MAHJHV55_50000 [Mycobacterium avium subsp. hominissuis]